MFLLGAYHLPCTATPTLTTYPISWLSFPLILKSSLSDFASVFLKSQCGFVFNCCEPGTVYTPVIPALERLNRRIRNSRLAGIRNELGASLSYMRTCLKITKKERRKKHNINNKNPFCILSFPGSVPSSTASYLYDSFCQRPGILSLRFFGNSLSWSTH